MINRIGLISLTLLVLSISAEAYFICFTHSQGILFKADQPKEEVSSSLVLNACLKHPYTKPDECRLHLTCFPQNRINTISFSN